MRYRFGGGIADWTFRAVTAGGVDGLAQLAAGEQITGWSDREGGSQYTHLLDSDGNPVASVVSAESGAGVGQIPVFWGPDGVQAMWVQAGTGPRALLVTSDLRHHTHSAEEITEGVFAEARIPAPAGGDTGGGPGLGELWIAAHDSPPEFQGADYVCDGVDDQVQFAAALTAAAGRRVVRPAPGTYRFSAAAVVDSAGADGGTAAIVGLNRDSAVIEVASSAAAAFQVAGSQLVLVENLSFVLSGSAAALAGGPWHSRLVNIAIEGDGTHTGWALDFSGAQNVLIESVRCEAVGNGVRLRNSTSAIFMHRVTVDVQADNSYGLLCDVGTGWMSRIFVEESEFITFSAGSTAIKTISGPTKTISGLRMQGLKVGGFATALDVEGTAASEFGFAYVNSSYEANTTLFRFDARSYGNVVSATELYAQASLALANDANTQEPPVPNILDGMRVQGEAGVVVSLVRNPLGTTVLRDITTRGAGNAAAVSRPPAIDAPHHVISLGNSGTAAQTIDCRRGSHFRVTATGNWTLANPVNPVDGQRLVVDVKQDGTGSRTMAVGNKFRFNTTFANATLTTAANKTDKLEWQYNGADDRWDLIRFVKGI